jgi:hypothetical protein
MANPCPEVQQVPWHLSIGMFIGVLGFLGVIVPLVREHIGRREKAVWVGVLAVLLFFELRSIHLDQVQHDREQAFAHCEQLQSFNQIAAALGTSIADSQAQFDATMGKINGVADNLSGGASFAYILPQPVPNATGYSANVFNDGNQMLTGVTVRIARVTGERGKPEEYWLDSGAIHAIPVNTVGPHSHVLMPDYWIYPTQNGVLVPHYLAVISAQNGDVFQDIYFRPARIGSGFACRFTVKKATKGGKYRTLKSVGWIEPKPL